MKRVLIREIESHIGKTVSLSGWVHRIRSLKSVTFLVLRDRTGLVQLAITTEQYQDLNLKLEAVISVTGLVVENNNTLKSVEVQVAAIECLSKVSLELPIQINTKELELSLDTLLNNRVLSLRHRKESAIFKIQAALAQSFSQFLRQNDFTEIHTPKLVKEGAEGGANVFSLDYFGEKAYLAQSPQFYKQIMVASGLERVYEVASVFRAEAHSTSRHLNEYVSMDLEIGFIESEKDLMALEGLLINFMLTRLKETCHQELTLLNVELPKIKTSGIPQMKLSEAITILKNQYGKTELEGDLDPESEKLICQHVYQETGSEFLFLTHYPQSKRPMYTLPCGEKETHSFDLLFRGLEITTGGMRIHDYETLLSSMSKKGLDPKAYESYLETFKYGAPPHGGLAIGLERLTAQLLELPNVRQASLFPRDCSRLIP